MSDSGASTALSSAIQSMLSKQGVQLSINFKNGSKVYCEVVGPRGRDRFAVCAWGCRHEITISFDDISSAQPAACTFRQHRQIRERQARELEGPAPGDRDRFDEDADLYRSTNYTAMDAPTNPAEVEGTPTPTKPPEARPRAASCEPGATVKAAHPTLGEVYGEVVAAKINDGRVALTVFGTGRTVVADASVIEKVVLTGKQIVAAATEQQSLFHASGARMRAKGGAFAKSKSKKS